MTVSDEFTTICNLRLHANAGDINKTQQTRLMYLINVILLNSAQYVFNENEDCNEDCFD